MPAPIFNYIKGKSNLVFFQDMFMAPDTMIIPDESADVTLAKCQKRLGILLQIKGMIESPGFRAFEEILMMRVKKLDSDIWGELIDQNQKTVMAMTVERTGIVSLFQSLEMIDRDIDTMNSSITSFESGDDPRTPVQEGELSA